MIEKTAIKYSMEMWEFLYKNPDKEKVDFPKFKKYGIDKMFAYCPCCEYYEQNDLLCNMCPLGNLCGRPNLAYRLWRNGINRSGNAKKIYDKLKEYYEVLI